jgi:hypothetical protein
MIPAEPTAIPAAHPDAIQIDARPELSSAPHDPTAGCAESTVKSEPDAAADPHTDSKEPAVLDDSPGHREDGDSGHRDQAARGGRRAEASIDQLAEIIAQAHPDSGPLTRAMARRAIEDQGLSAGNERIAEALRRLQPGEAARPHPHMG